MEDKKGLTYHLTVDWYMYRLTGLDLYTIGQGLMYRGHTGSIKTGQSAEKNLFENAGRTFLCFMDLEH